MAGPMALVSKGKQGLSLLGKAVRLAWTASPGWTLASMGLIGLQSVAPLALLYFTKLTLDAVSLALRAPEAADQGVILRWVVLTAVAAWMVQFMRSLSSHVDEIQGEIVSEYVQNIIARKASNLDLAYYENPAYIDTLHLTQHEAPFRPARVVHTLVQLIQSALSLVALAGLVLFYFRWSAVAVVLAVAAVGLFSRLRTVQMHFQWRMQAAAQERRLGYYNWLLNSAAAAKEIRLYGLGAFFSRQVAELRESLRRQRLRISTRRMARELATQACASAALGVALWSLIRGTLARVLTLGDLVMNLQALQRAVVLLQELIGSGSQMYEHGLFLNRLYQFLALSEHAGDPPHPKALPAAAQRDICFENVGFHYPATQRRILDGVSFRIEPGQMVAFVGENGAGKSTLIKLLCRLYDPVEGRITVGGIDLRELKRSDHWRSMAVLFQDFVQYMHTVSENIWFGDIEKEATEAQLHAAAERGGAAAFVPDLPGGYGQMLGLVHAGGTELSGGQWQKIALSRAFFRDASIVILDEPSSALDVRSEHEIFTRFKELTAGKTSVVISHRLSSVRMADRIFYLEHGRLVEAGSHEELMSLGGAYSALFKTQASSYQ